MPPPPGQPPGRWEGESTVPSADAGPTAGAAQLLKRPLAASVYAFSEHRGEND